MPEVPDLCDKSSLRALIAPASVAILGASDRPSGALSLIRSLQRLNFAGPSIRSIHDTRPSLD
jgi:hypothetical protein